MESDASEKDTNVENIRQTSPYKEDPGALLEPGGKEVGDKDFLLSLSDPKSEGKPDNLLGVVIQEDSGRTENIGQYLSGENITNTLVYEDVQLHEAETEDEKETQMLYKKVRDILNKLTQQNFNASLYQIKVLPINTLKRLQGVADLVFEKAVGEPKFSVLCANMCSELAMMKMMVGDKKEGEKHIPFRKLLITKCQLEFEKLMLKKEDRRLRSKSLGTVRFIGELFKKGMLTCNIMLRCVDNLLQNKDDESLESLCILLLTIGQELEKRRVSLNDIFITMKEIADRKHGEISSRVRFMLQDVIDLRSAKWVSRRQDSNLKTIDQIQKEANDEQLNIQTMNSGPHTLRKDDRNTSTVDRKQRRNNVSDSEGWTTSQSRGSRSAFTVQSEKLKNKPSQIDKHLGSSQMFGQWCRGSNSKSNTQSSHPNMYAPLENMGNDVEKRNSMAGGYRSKDPYTSKGPSLERNCKHSYEDQWAPFNPERKKVYDSDFFLALRTDLKSKLEPDNLLIGQLPAHCTITVEDNNDFDSHFSATKKLSSQCDFQIDELLGFSQMFDQMPSTSDATVPIKAPLEVNPEKMKNILKKYLNDVCAIAACNKDINENIPELDLIQLVSLYHNILEQTTIAQLKLSGLFSQLIKVNRLPLDSHCISSEDVLEADDLTIDIPKLWEYLGERIAPLLYENTISLRSLHKSCSVLINQGDAAKLLAPIFKLVISEKGSNYLASLWKSSELNLSDFMPAEKVMDFISENQFEFLVDNANTSMSQSVFTYEQIHNILLEFFQAEKSFDDIINWIAANLGDRVKEKKFIRILATAIFKSSITKNKLNCQTIRKHYNLLRYFVGGTPEYELQTLYALQAIINKLKAPEGLYLMVFTTIYHDAILSHDSFLRWETSSDAAEQDGKDIALKQLSTFFTNIKKADLMEFSSEDD